ncbi:hypothetical protein Tsubulata_014257 [Turnera subulata]|uniref:BTB domain-containing protein n=1 Tax=Turnera subulata TaxID=218843 RepID=A0A9Q0G4U1_9ROSI|nr:hypothetical protein Tsubulata_014257 [Turnera subulata]
MSEKEQEAEPNFEFAFNNPNFSDRDFIIKIKPGLQEDNGYPIIPVPQEDSYGSEAPPPYARILHKLREGVAMLKEQRAIFITPLLNNQRLSGKMVPGDDSSTNKIITIHIASAILAGKSPIFHDLLSKQSSRQVILELNVHEEAPFVNLLHFIYGRRNLSNTTNAGDWVDLLIVAHRFRVKSCVTYCCKFLLGLMGWKSVFLYFCLASVTNMDNSEEEVKHLIQESAKFLIKNCTFKRTILLLLPLKGLQAYLSADELEVDSEDSVFDFVQLWAYLHYPIPEERREFFRIHVDSLVRFPFMSTKRLEQIHMRDDVLDPDHKKETVLKALLYKVGGAKSRCSMRQRAYKFRPVRVVVFDSPKEGCAVYLDLKREEFERLHSEDRTIFTEQFLVGNEEVHVLICYDKDGQNVTLYVLKIKKESEIEDFTLHIAARLKGPREEFASLGQVYYNSCTASVSFVMFNAFGAPWSEFISDGSKFFINGVFHLRVEIVITKYATASMG